MTSTPSTPSSTPSTLITDVGGSPVELHVTVYDGRGRIREGSYSAGLVLSFGRSKDRPKDLLDAMAKGGPLWELCHGLADVQERDVERFPLGLSADDEEDLYTSDVALTVYFDPSRGWTAVASGRTVKRYQLWGHLPVDLRTGVPLALPDRVAIRVPSGAPRDHVIVLEQDPAVCREQTARLLESNLTSGTITLGGAVELDNAGVDAAGYDFDGAEFTRFELSDDDLTAVVIMWEQYLRFDPPLPNPQISKIRGKKQDQLFGAGQGFNDRLRSIINEAAEYELLSVAGSGTAPQHLEFLHKVAMRNGLTYERVQEIRKAMPPNLRGFLEGSGDDRSGVREDEDDS